MGYVVVLRVIKTMLAKGFYLIFKLILNLADGSLSPNQNIHLREQSLFLNLYNTVLDNSVHDPIAQTKSRVSHVR